MKTTVIQPRLDHVDSEVVILKELLLWGEEEVAPRAIMAMEGTDYMAAGDWCRFCPAKTRCRKRAEFNLELARMEFQKPPLLSDEEIAEGYGIRSDAVRMRLTRARREVYALLNKGEK